MQKSELEEYIFETYGVLGEHPWEKYPRYAVFRHGDNRKWFAVIMRIPISKLGVLENREVNVVNLKCTEEAMDSVWQDDGIFPAYHMNKEHWITVLLDGSVDADTVKLLLKESYKATAAKTKKKKAKE